MREKLCQGLYNHKLTKNIIYIELRPSKGQRNLSII